MIIVQKRQRCRGASNNMVFLAMDMLGRFWIITTVVLGCISRRTRTLFHARDTKRWRFLNDIEFIVMALFCLDYLVTSPCPAEREISYTALS
jgi:hypothetical protein